MGIDAAPFGTNLVLYFYKNKFMAELISNNKVKTQHFHSTNRFIDNLRAINDGIAFGSTQTEIYPKELKIQVEHQRTHSSFLNLDITMMDRKFVYKLYSKRYSFKFLIVRMPYIDTNIPNNIFYLAFVSETFSITCSTLHFPLQVAKYENLL